MKLLLLLILAPVVSYSQDGWANASLTHLFRKGYSNEALTINGGKRLGMFGVGLNADFYMKDKFASAAVDARVYITRSKLSPYLSIQPGVILKNTKEEQGSYSIGAIGGLDWRPNKKEGLTLFGGYQYTSFKRGERVHYDNFKIGLGILF